MSLSRYIVIFILFHLGVLAAPCVALGASPLGAPDALAGRDSAPPASHKELAHQIASFEKALVRRDERALKKYFLHPEDYFPGGHIDPEVDRFLFRERRRDGLRSIQTIANIDHIIPKIVVEGDGNLLVLFLPKKYYWSGRYFLENEWMKEYFACRFQVSGARTFSIGFCFAESDGPFGKGG